MAADSLRDVIIAFEESGELIRIKEPVDPVLEITEICDRVVKAGGPALLFENPRGYNIPVLINLYGTERRMARILGLDSFAELEKKVAGEISLLLDRDPAQSLFDKLKALPQLMRMASYMPKRVKSGPCKEVIRKSDINLLEYPILQCWPGDGGRFITLPLVFSKDPETGARNCGMYRMQVYDETTTGMHWQIHKHGADHARSAKRLGRKIEVAVALGSNPAATFCGAMPAPPGVDEMLVAGFLRGEGVEMVPCETVDLEVPADAEIVLEGVVDPNDLRTEGPFGDHTGFYSLADEYPVFRVQCVTHRKNPVYHTIMVGIPPMEDCYMGAAIERFGLPVIRRQFPEIIDMHMPFAGIFHNLVIVSIRKAYAGHARKVMHALWGFGQAMFSKVILVVDEGADVRHYGEIAWRVLNNIDPERDIEFVHGPIDVLDHASRLPHYGSKMGVDATRKWKTEGFDREWPDEMRMSAEIKKRVDEIWGRLGIKV